MLAGPPSSSVQHPYFNSGLPLSSNSMQRTSNGLKQFDVPPTKANPQFPNSQPPVPNQTLSSVNGASPYQHPPDQPPYNGLPNNPSPRLIGYPSPSHYPNLSGLSSMPGNQLNRPNSYPGQLTSSGPVPQPLPQPRIDSDMLPNVVRIFFLKKHSFVHKNIDLDSST